MNRAENIIALVNFAIGRDAITRKDAVRVLSMVGTLLNGDGHETDIDASPGMIKLWKEVNRKWEPSPEEETT